MVSANQGTSWKQLLILWTIRIAGVFLGLWRIFTLVLVWLKKKDRQHFWSPKKRNSPPACLVNPKVGRHGFAQLKDVRLHYVEAGDRKNPLLLCLHGFPECWFSFKNQLRAFSKTHWVVAVDLRGYGESDKPQGADQYQVPILVDDIRQLITKLGRDKCVLMGHDWGGAIGWTFAVTHPNMLTQYIALNCPHIPVFRQFVTSTWKQLWMSKYMYFFQIPWVPELAMSINDNQIMNVIGKEGFSEDQDPSEDIEAYKYFYSQPNAWNAPINYYRRLFSSSSPLWMSDKQLRVKVPTLLVFGTKDHVLDYRMVPECAKHVDNFQYEFIEGATHWVMFNAPDKVNAAVAKFLKVTL